MMDNGLNIDMPGRPEAPYRIDEPWSTSYGEKHGKLTSVDKVKYTGPRVIKASAERDVIME